MDLLYQRAIELTFAATGLLRRCAPRNDNPLLSLRAKRSNLVPARVGSKARRYYARNAGRQTADNMVRQIAGASRVIEEYPLGGRARDELRRGLRSVTVRSHVIFYRVTRNGLEIVRLLDGRRDLDEIFAGE